MNRTSVRNQLKADQEKGNTQEPLAFECREEPEKLTTASGTPACGSSGE